MSRTAVQVKVKVSIVAAEDAKLRPRHVTTCTE